MPIPPNTGLLLIDIQKGFEETEYWGKNRNNPEAEKKAAMLLNLWREEGQPIIHTRHDSSTQNSPLARGKEGNEFMDIVKPLESETVFGKSANSAFIGTELENHLRQAGIETLIIAGLTTDHCVSTTVRMAGNLGFRVYLIEDACATWDKTGPDGKNYSAQELHDVNLASLNKEFCRVITSRDILNF